MESNRCATWLYLDGSIQSQSKETPLTMMISLGGEIDAKERDIL